MEKNEAHITVTDTDPNNLQIAISGQLGIDTTAKFWQQCMDVQKLQPETLTVDAKELSYCDGAGIGLLLELQKRQVQAQKQFHINNLNAQFQKLMELAAIPIQKKEPQAEAEPSLRVKVGVYIIKAWQNIRENVVFLGMLSYYSAHALMRPRTIRWRDFWKAIVDVGPNALPLTALIGFLIGLITTFQASAPLERFGAQIYLVNLVGLGLFREMGPLMVAVLLAGRTASSFAAELGTMKINQEVDALTTMGLEPIQFLVIPRVLATTLMAPFLSMFLILFGLIGCGLVMSTLGFNLHIYMDQLQSAVTIPDFVSGLIKTFVFGIVIASVGCLHGLKTRMGASAVGYSTTRAVVSSIVMVVFIDGIFAAIYYVLGI